MITLMWIALGALGACILVAGFFGVRAVWREVANKPGPDVPDDTGHVASLGPRPPEIAHDGAYDIGSMDLDADSPHVLARAQGYGDISGLPDGLLWAELTPAAAVVAPIDPPSIALPPPPVHPLDAKLAEIHAIQAEPIDEYVKRLARTWEEDSGIGIMPAIRAEGDHDGPLSIPAEVLHEMEADV